MADEPSQPLIHVALGIVLHEARVLICRRPEDAVLGGLWEFPGGKVESGELINQALLRELREELAIEVRIVDALPTISFDYPHGRIILHPFVCQWTGGEVTPLGCSGFKWIESAELMHHRFPPANEALLRRVTEIMKKDEQ